MRIVITGKRGQVVTALTERAARSGVDLIAVGRPEFDLSNAHDGLDLIALARPDVIVSAAAYTAVDKAETDAASAEAINARGAGQVARIAEILGVPIIHLSTNYVFDGAKSAPYVETDLTKPLCVYGATKLRGEMAVAAAAPNHVILRTAWIYSPFGHNFMKTMLRLAVDQPVLRVVDDQRGNPTSALDIADAIIKVARNMLDRPEDLALRGVFHLSGAGEGSWADFANTIFSVSEELGGPAAQVRRISTAEYPTPARRPANSRLSNGKLALIHGVNLPEWTASTRRTLERILARPEH